MISNSWHVVHFDNIIGDNWREMHNRCLAWCIDNLKNDTWMYPAGTRKFYFKLKEDATWFKLTWCNNFERNN